MLGSVSSRWVLIWTVVAALAPVATAQHGGHGSHIPMPDQKFVLHCRLDKDDASWAEVPLELPSPSAPVKLNRALSMPAHLPSVRLTEYLPRAKVEQHVSTSPDTGTPAIELSIDGPTQSYQRWLMAADPQHNRLTSFIGTWRYMAVETQAERDELHAQFVTELTRPPRLLVVREDGSGMQEIPVRTGEPFKIEGFDHLLRVRKFIGDFGVNESTGEPVARTDRRLNPAALVEMEHEGRRFERWVFARFPDFAQERDVPLPFKLLLDCPVEHESQVPDHVIVTVARTAHEVWSRYQGEIDARPFKANQRIDVAGSQYSFHVGQYLPAGRLVEVYRPTDTGGGQPALRIELPGYDGKAEAAWLPLGKQRTFDTPKGRVVMAFGPKAADAQKGH